MEGREREGGWGIEDVKRREVVEENMKGKEGVKVRKFGRERGCKGKGGCGGGWG